MKEQIAEEEEIDRDSWPPDETSRPTHRIFFPVLLLALAVVGWFGFQTIELVKERSLLNQAQAGQEAQVQQSLKVRSALDALARDTAQLAERGNANAKLLVEELRKRNITINPNAPPPSSTEKK